MFVNTRNPATGKISWPAAFWCLVALFICQLLTGTSPLFAQLVFMCLALGVITVNFLGGIAELSGFCVFVMLLKLVLVSQWLKVFFGEPAEGTLTLPLLTMLVMVAGFAGMSGAALLTLPLRFRTPRLKPMLDFQSLRLAGILTYGLGTLCCLGSIAAGGEDGMLRVGGIPGLLRQLMFVSKLSIVFTTAAVIVQTEKRSSLKLLNGLPIATYFGFGLLTASKQALLDPFLIYGLTVWAFGYRLRLKHVMAAAVIVVFAQLVLFPFAQNARNVIRVFGLRDSITATSEFVGVFIGDSQFRDQLSDNPDQETNYFNRPAGLMERFGLIKAIDMLVTETQTQGQSRWDTIVHGFNMLVPRAINPTKPAVNTGNYLGHKAGLLDDSDEGTQVSFGFIADGFSAFGWWGAVLIPFCILFSFTVAYRWLVGPLWQNVWAVYLFAEFQHSFTEQTIASMIITICLSPFSYLVIYYGVEFCRSWMSRGRLFDFGAKVQPARVNKAIGL